MKKCSGCKVLKNKFEFSGASIRADGLQAYLRHWGDAYFILELE